MHEWILSAAYLYAAVSKDIFLFRVLVKYHQTVPNYNQQDATFLIYLFLQPLYMFQVVTTPIIRST